MGIIKKYNKWANHHSYFIFDFLRVLAGGFMIYKGLSFMSKPEYYDYFANQIEKIGGIHLVHLIVSLNIIGGIMIVIGFLTRWVILAQLPILFGAAIINFTGKMEIQNLAASIMILSVFVFFVFFGSGKHSVDYYYKMQA